MKNFLKYMLASTLGTILGFFVVVFMGGIIIAGIIGSVMMFSGKGKGEKEVKPNSVLVVDLSKQIVERKEANPFEEFEIEGFGDDGRMELSAMLEAIENAETDTNIKGILIRGEMFSGGLSTMGTVRDQLEEFKESGKFIMSYEEMYTLGAYYVSSVADEVYLFQEGMLDFRGMRSEVAYFKGAMDKLGIDALIIKGKDNKYKSAVEPFYRESMSPENREQIQRILDNVWGELLVDLEDARGISSDEFNRIADDLDVDSPDKAVELGLVDGLVYYDHVQAKIREKLGLEEDEKIPSISLSEYAKVDHKEETDKDDKSWELKDEIAVIYAVGGIESGEGDEQTIGSETLAKAIREARLDEDVKAIVMRVNSPGGSALASEVIWRESVLAGESKPFIVSFGDVAASGGYYISTHADRIFGQPNTITGSIGAFGIMPDMRGFFNDKLGITFDAVKTNKFSDFGSLSRPFDEAEIAYVQGYLDDVYTEFVEKVADGRGMTYDMVDSLGRGRVWTGSDALAAGLMDEMGSLDDAIAYAATQAELEDYEIRSFPERTDPFKKFMKDMRGEAKATVASWVLGDEAIWLKKIDEVKEMDGIQMRLPYELRIY